MTLASAVFICFSVTFLVALQTLKIYNTFNSLRDPIQGILQGSLLKPFPTNIYLLKVNNGNTKKRCEMCSKLKIKAPERRH